jgi:peroxiredoxin
MVSKTFNITRCFAFIIAGLLLSGMAGSPPILGGPAPAFELKSLDGGTVQMSELKGEFVVLNFWATWCVPCMKEMPELQKAHESFGDKNIKVIAINFGESEKKVHEFTRDFGLSFPVLLDRRGNTSAKYRVLNLPVTYFISPDGIIRDAIHGSVTQEVIESKINQIKDNKIKSAGVQYLAGSPKK